MNSRKFRMLRAALPVLVLGWAVPVWSQDGGPIAPAQNAPAPAAAPAPAPASAPASTPAPASAPAPALVSATAKPAMIEVPGGTHIPLVLHNAISTRSALRNLEWNFGARGFAVRRAGERGCLPGSSELHLIRFEKN